MIFALPYKLLQVSGIDNPITVRAVPKVVGGLVAALGDFYTVSFIDKYWDRPGIWGILVTALSPWNCFTLTRSFSNSLETSLTAFALYRWPFGATEKLWNDHLFYSYVQTTIQSFAAIGFAFLIRPTTSVVWIVPAVRQIIEYGTTFIFEAIFAAYVTIQYSAIIDSFYYGVISFPVINFLRFNASGSASFYGVNNWHYYLTQGVPLLLTGFLPYALHGVFLPCVNKREFLSIIGFVCIVYSMLAHKEVRFIMPILPLLHGFAAHSLARAAKSRSVLQKTGIAIALGINCLVGFYATQVHQRGVVDFVQHVSEHHEITHLTLLMPCHSTPWQSHIHRPGNFRFLTCEPPLGMSKEAVETYRDEADTFYDDIDTFMEGDQKVNGAPDYVATFEASQDALENYWSIHDQPYRLQKRWFNTRIHDDKRRVGDVLLYKIEDDFERIED